MRKTTEKSIEINVLRKLVNWLEKKLERQITVLAPSQQLERKVGYDELLHGLPRGRVIALQFKRPNESLNFQINIRQMEQLYTLFVSPGCAFYIFSPFPTHLNLIHGYDVLLHKSIAVDVHKMPHLFPFTKKYNMKISYQLKFHSLIDCLYRDLNGVFHVSDFCHKFNPDTIGIDKDYLYKVLKSKKTTKFMVKRKHRILYIPED